MKRYETYFSWWQIHWFCNSMKSEQSFIWLDLAGRALVDAYSHRTAKVLGDCAQRFVPQASSVIKVICITTKTLRPGPSSPSVVWQIKLAHGHTLSEPACFIRLPSRGPASVPCPKLQVSTYAKNRANQQCRMLRLELCFALGRATASLLAIALHTGTDSKP